MRRRASSTARWRSSPTGGPAGSGRGYRFEAWTLDGRAGGGGRRPAASARSRSCTTPWTRRAAPTERSPRADGAVGPARRRGHPGGEPRARGRGRGEFAQAATAPFVRGKRDLPLRRGRGRRHPRHALPRPLRPPPHRRPPGRPQPDLASAALYGGRPGRATRRGRHDDRRGQLPEVLHRRPPLERGRALVSRTPRSPGTWRPRSRTCLYFAGDQIYEGDLTPAITRPIDDAPARLPPQVVSPRLVLRRADPPPALRRGARRPRRLSRERVGQRRRARARPRRPHRPGPRGATRCPPSLRERGPPHPGRAPARAARRADASTLGITTYHTTLNWGGGSFAVLADRMYKSPPAVVVPEGRVRNGWSLAPDFDPADAVRTSPGRCCSGASQLGMLADWGAAWPSGRLVQGLPLADPLRQRGHHPRDRELRAASSPPSRSPRRAPTSPATSAPPTWTPTGGRRPGRDAAVTAPPGGGSLPPDRGSAPGLDPALRRG